MLNMSFHKKMAEGKKRKGREERTGFNFIGGVQSNKIANGGKKI